LRRSEHAVEVLIDKGADVSRVASGQVEKDKYGNVRMNTAARLCSWWDTLFQKERPLDQHNRKKRQGILEPEFAKQEALQAESDKLKIDEYKAHINSWELLNQVPSRAGIKSLFKGGLGTEELTMRERSDGPSPYDIIYVDDKNMSKSTPFHREIKEKSHSKIGKLLEDKCGNTTGFL
jgi:hypothetical protein